MKHEGRVNIMNTRLEVEKMGGSNPYRDLAVVPDSLETDPTEMDIPNLMTETELIEEHLDHHLP
jgi:hypothetical protein